ATKDAGTISGLNVLRVINEPTAAAIAYGLDKKKGMKSRLSVRSSNSSPETSDNEQSNERKVLVFDLGGGTLDVSLLSIGMLFFEGVVFFFFFTLSLFSQILGIPICIIHLLLLQLHEKHTYCLVLWDMVLFIFATVKATAGDTHLGGEDFDNILVTIFLLYVLFCGLLLPTICKNAFERCDIVVWTLVPLLLRPGGQVLRDSKISREEIDDVVLVGGSTRIPKIQEMIKEFFNGRDPCTSIDPEEAVAYGAAIQGAILSGQASTEETKNLLLLDVTPLSLGVEIAGGEMNVIIPRNTPIPTKVTDYFSTFHDNQTRQREMLEEEEDKNNSNNNNNIIIIMINIYTIYIYIYIHKRGGNSRRFQLRKIPKQPRGVPKILVTFAVDENGILHVSAVDETSKISNSIVITNEKGRLTQEEIDNVCSFFFFLCYYLLYPLHGVPLLFFLKKKNLPKLNKMILQAEQHRHEDSMLKATLKAHTAMEQFLYAMHKCREMSLEILAEKTGGHDNLEEEKKTQPQKQPTEKRSELMSGDDDDRDGRGGMAKQNKEELKGLLSKVSKKDCELLGDLYQHYHQWWKTESIQNISSSVNINLKQKEMENKLGEKLTQIIRESFVYLARTPSMTPSMKKFSLQKKQNVTGGKLTEEKVSFVFFLRNFRSKNEIFTFIIDPIIIVLIYVLIIIRNNTIRNKKFELCTNFSIKIATELTSKTNSITGKASKVLFTFAKQSNVTVNQRTIIKLSRDLKKKLENHMNNY
ncbi:hypothetical protein RFI_22366, partial [Reticulomyxa filosa]